MADVVAASVRQQIDELYRAESRRVFASLVRLLGDFDLAEDALHEAFAAAAEVWPRDGVPAQPRAWLVSTGRFKAIDALRRHAKLKAMDADLATRQHAVAESNAERATTEIEDDRLRLIFICCHPAIDPKLRVPLTLREVCGLTTEEIARAFLTTKGSMAQRIVRGKARIREAGIAIEVPERDELPARLGAVLATIYLVFNEGYATSRGDELIRVDLTEEAIRLGRLLLELLPEPDVQGLLALMLFHESRRAARVCAKGEIILLEDQDRSRWNQELVREGTVLVEQALRSRRFGSYTLQAAIAAVHAEAPTSQQTDWDQIVVLYSHLWRREPSPVIELNRAVAIAMRDGHAAGLALIEAILARGDLVDYRPAHAARGELLRRAGRSAEAASAFERALELSEPGPERRLLEARLAELQQLSESAGQPATKNS